MRTCVTIVNNTSWYRRISSTTVLSYNSDFLQLINTAKLRSIIDKATWEFLNVTWPQIPTFCTLPKIHKNTTLPPVRPIISGINSITIRASILVDDFLKPFVVKLRSYLKGSMHPLKICQQLKLPLNTILVTIDIESLYSNIPLEKGIKIIGQYLRNLDTNQKATGSFILYLFKFILTHNYFFI